MAIGNKKIESYNAAIRLNQGLYTKLDIKGAGSANFDFSGSTGTFKTPSGTLTLGSNTITGSPSFSGSVTAGGAITGTGGLVQVGTNQSTVFHSGGHAALTALTTGYHQTQFVSTVSYVCEVFIPANTVITGISVANGATTSASQNTFVGLADSTGTVVAKSNTTTAQGAASTYQQIPFTATYSAKGPAKHFILVQGSNTTGYLGTHHAGNFSATSVTSETYGTFLTTAAYATTTFTADVGPVADTY